MGLANVLGASAIRGHQVKTPDGVEIAVQEWGNPAGPEVLFIHGFCQCHLSWSRQVTSELARDFRMVTYDFRGHGASDKPLEPEFYQEGDRWADELAAVIEVADLKKPVIVGWSYAGRIISDYLARFGTARLAGINFVGSKTNGSPEFANPLIIEHQRHMAGPDLNWNVLGTVAFLKACAESWDPEDFQYQLAFNMVVPPEVRGALLNRRFAADEYYRRLDVPMLFTHGQRDRIAPVAAAIYGQSITPGSTLSLYETAGHAPFMEDTARFNAELAAFVRRCQR